MTTQLYTLSDAEFNQLVGVPWQLGQSLRTRINAAFALGIERARLAQSDWVRVEDALPVIPDGARNVAIWEFGGQYSLRPMRSDYDYEGFWPEDGITHWRYAEPTPNPPEQKP